MKHGSELEATLISVSFKLGKTSLFSDTQSIFAKADFNRVSASGTVSVSLGGNGGFSAGHIFADADASFTTRDAVLDTLL